LGGHSYSIAVGETRHVWSINRLPSTDEAEVLSVHACHTRMQKNLSQRISVEESECGTILVGRGASRARIPLVAFNRTN
jgi:hypothetical protein